MRRHIALALLLAILLVFSLLACDRNGESVDVAVGDVVMNSGSSTTTTTNNTGEMPDMPETDGGVDLPFLPA